MSFHIFGLIVRLVSLLFIIVAQFFVSSAPQSFILNDDPLEGSAIGEGASSEGKVNINILPDDALLRVFDFYVDGARDEDAWHTLVHVCQSWRFIVFASPCRLNLQLVCTENRLVRVMLDIWPALPMIVCILGSGHEIPGESMDNIISALECNDRICRISLCARGSLLERFAAAMQESFPELMSLKLRSNDVAAPVLSETFLGGSAPRLQSLYLDGVTFPTLPKLLLSARDLVDLCLLDIPPSGYIPPEVMVTCLTVMTKLGTLELVFRSPRSLPDQTSRHPPLQTRAVLPALTSLVFLGDSEYLEDISARIDAPLLDHVSATFFHQPIFDTPQFLRFIGRTEEFKAPILAEVVLLTDFIAMILSRKIGDLRTFMFRILCPRPDWQLSALLQVCNSSSPPFSTLEQLKIYDYSSLLNEPHWLEDVQEIQWLHLLRLFATVKNLVLSEQLALHIAHALQNLHKGGAADVLPALQNLFIEGPIPPGPIREVIGKFVAARQLSGHPVVVHY